MTPCHEQLRLAAYHDGELTLADRAGVERHLAGCEACQRELVQLRRVSTWLTAAAAEAAEALSPIGRARLHRRVDAVVDGRTEQSLVRFGWELSGLAAAVLLAGSAWLTWAANGPAVAAVSTTAGTAVATVPPWVGAQAVAVADPVGQPAVAATPAAMWYLADGSVPRE